MAELKQRFIQTMQRMVAASKRLKKGSEHDNKVDLIELSIDPGSYSISSRRFLLASAVLGLSMTGVYMLHNEASAEQAYKVYDGNTYLGMVHSKEEMQQKLESLHLDQPQSLSYKLVALTDRTKFDALHTQDVIQDLSPIDLQVNRQSLVTLANRTDADLVLKNIEQFYLKDEAGDTKATIEDSIQFVPTQNRSAITNVADAVHQLLRGADTPQMYVVSRGDTLWDIAQKENVSVDKLVSTNPTVKDENSLQLGQQLVINKLEPIIHVKVEQTITKDVSVPFTTQYEDDDSMATGDTNVISQGMNGLETQTLHITYENGTIVKQDVLNRIVKKQMVQAVVRRGTNSGIASGDYIWPTESHLITAPYGENRGYELHPGVDIGSYTGAPIWASNNGTVIAAGWDNGGYGNCVRIDHGNGVVSIYGHMSRVDVQVGQRVKKGQQIGLIGMTGEATGPHLHYEIHVNGVRCNPAPYM